MTAGLNDKERHLAQLLFEAGIKIGYLEKQVQQLELELKQLSDENTLLRHGHFRKREKIKGLDDGIVEKWWRSYASSEPYIASEFAVKPNTEEHETLCATPDVNQKHGYGYGWYRNQYQNRNTNCAALDPDNKG